jgi:hypothetical protein
MTEGLILAVPVLVMVTNEPLSVKLQLDPEVPVFPVEDIVKVWALDQKLKNISIQTILVPFKEILFPDKLNFRRKLVVK